MSGFDFLGRSADAETRLHGVAVGLVSDNQDPDGLGRVKVRFPWLSGDNESQWARVAAPMAGEEIGLYILPEVGDEVLVAFAHGRPDLPYVLGCLWNGKAPPPVDNGDGENGVRMLRTTSFEIVINEKDKSLVACDRERKNAVTIDANAKKISLVCEGDVEVEAKGQLSLKGQNGVAIESGGGAVNVKASANLELEASGSAELKGAVIDVKGNPINLN